MDEINRSLSDLLLLVLGASVSVVLTATNVLDEIEEWSDAKGLVFTLVGAAVDDNPLNAV